MNTGDRVRILEGASDWMKKHGRWMDFLPDSIDGAQGIVVADYTHFSGNNCHYIIEIDNGIGMLGIYPMWLIPVDARAGQNQSDPATRMHACLICQHSQMFGQPERLLANDTISFGFECVGPPLQGAYGLEHAPHTMIFWPETMTVNVDGGQSIPNGGCEGYIYRSAAVACDAVCQQPKRAEKKRSKCMNLSELPADWPQRQDSLSEQFADLRIIANRLGFQDAADAIGQLFDTSRLLDVRYGCHLDLEHGSEPDGCVIDDGNLHHCIYAKAGMRKEQCAYWRIVSV